jgi:hypothetical protein
MLLHELGKPIFGTKDRDLHRRCVEPFDWRSGGPRLGFSEGRRPLPFSWIHCRGHRWGGGTGRYLLIHLPGLQDLSVLLPQLKSTSSIPTPPSAEAAGSSKTASLTSAATASGESPLIVAQMNNSVACTSAMFAIALCILPTVRRFDPGLKAVRNWCVRCVTAWETKR